MASKTIGDQPVSRIQTMDEFEMKYEDKIKEADEMFYAENLPEARVSYLIASDIRPKEEYPIQQIEIIQNKLSQSPFEANLSSFPDAVSPIPELTDPAAPAVIEVEEEVTPEVEEEVVAEIKKEVEEVVEEKETIVFRNILFDFDKSELRKESISELNKVVSIYVKAISRGSAN